MAYLQVHLLEELLSPIITPFVLWFHTRPRALEFVDFYRNFTLDIEGVGDVCSFAQMDVRRHGNPTWHTSGNGNHKPAPTGNPAFVMPSSIGEQAVPCTSNQYTQVCFDRKMLIVNRLTGICYNSFSYPFCI